MVVKVQMEIERVAKALNQGNRTGAGRVTAHTRLVHQIRGDGPVGESKHPAHDCWPGRDAQIAGIVVLIQVTESAQ